MVRRQNKRERDMDEGGSSHNFVPLGADDFLDVHAREGSSMKIGYQKFMSPPKRTTQKSNEHWKVATSWGPLDDPDFALDSDGALYNEAVDAPVMQDTNPPVTVGTKNTKSKTSRRPHVVWKENHRSTFLDEMIRNAGRGSFRNESRCPDCISCGVDPPGQPVYRCNDCFIPDLACQSCCIRRHANLPFHRVEKWTGSFFEDVSLKSLGLTLQLNHRAFCENPLPCHTSMTPILHHQPPTSPLRPHNSSAAHSVCRRNPNNDQQPSSYTHRQAYSSQPPSSRNRMTTMQNLLLG